MNNETFKQKLSQVADWQIPALPNSTVADINKQRGRKTAEEKYQEEHEEVFLDIYQGINPTHPLELTQVKCQGCACEDCGNFCANGRHLEKKLYITSGHKTWREKCITCNKSKNPFTGVFDLTPSEASNVWADYLRERKGLYSTKKNKQIAEGNVVITKYPESSSIK
jgi:hypothetical protein